MDVHSILQSNPTLLREVMGKMGDLEMTHATEANDSGTIVQRREVLLRQNDSFHNIPCYEDAGNREECPEIYVQHSIIGKVVHNLI